MSFAREFWFYVNVGSYYRRERAASLREALGARARLEHRGYPCSEIYRADEHDNVVDLRPARATDQEGAA
jgi:hypothetical protein